MWEVKIDGSNPANEEDKADVEDDEVEVVPVTELEDEDDAFLDHDSRKNVWVFLLASVLDSAFSAGDFRFLVTNNCITNDLEYEAH